MAVKLIVGGDLVPTQSNYKLFEAENIRELVGADIVEYLQNADYTIFNLETPLFDSVTPITKCGPNLNCPKAMVKGIKALGVDFFTLANNHILDQGPKGLQSTIDSLKKEGIAYAGAGENIFEAQKPHFVTINGIDIGVYCCAEHEFTISSEKRCGANPFDYLESLDHIVELRKKCDYLIVLHHGGKEHYRYPSPDLQRLCRKMVEKGADLVVCQHTHCIGAKEVWPQQLVAQEGENKRIKRKGTIIYGQGNFIFDYNNSEYWQTSLLLSIELGTDKEYKDLSVEVTYLPIKKHGNKIRLANEIEKDRILSEFQQRSSEIVDKDKVKQLYSDFSERGLNEYLYILTGKLLRRNLIVRILNKLSGYLLYKYFIKRFIFCVYGKKSLLAIRNIIECEAHRELFLAGINRKIFKRYLNDK